MAYSTASGNRYILYIFKWARILSLWIGFFFVFPTDAWVDDYLVRRHWNSTDGLGESYIRHVSIGPSGNVYAVHGTINTFSFLDGFSVRTLSCSTDIGAVYEDPEGNLWSTNSNGLQVYHNDDWIHFAIPEVSTIDGFIYRERTILPISSNLVLVILPKRLLQFNRTSKNTTVIKEAETTGLEEFSQIITAQDGGVWILGKRGAAKLTCENGIFSTSSNWIELLFGDQYIIQNIENTGFLKITESVNGELYCSVQSLETSQYGVLHWDGASWRSIVDDKDDLLLCWPGLEGYWSAKGFPLQLVFKKGDNRRVFEVGGGLFKDHYKIAVENEKVFWIGKTLGLTRYALALFQTPYVLNGVQNCVHSIIEDAQGRIWFDCLKQLALFDNNEWKLYLFPEGYETVFYTTQELCTLPDGRIVMRTENNHSLLIFDPVKETFEEVYHPEGLNVLFISQRKEGGVWAQVGANSRNYRLEIYDGKEFKLFLDMGSLWKIGQLRFIHEEENGNLWLGGMSEERVGLLRDGQYQTFGGLYPGNGALCVHRVDEDTLWFSDRDGLYEFDGRKWSTIKTGLDQIPSVITAQNGDIWVASWSGLHRYRNGSWLTNTVEDGLPSSNILKIFEDSQGRIWIGTSNGLSLYHPNADRDAPETIIPSDKNSKIIPYREPVQFMFEGMDKWKYTKSERLYYSCRIDGGAWSPYTSKTVFSATIPTAGEHRFEVHSMDRNWNIDAKPATYQFTVLLPWYRQTIFVILFFTSAVTIVFLGVMVINRHWRLNKTVLQLQEANQSTQIANESLREEITRRERIDKELVKARDAAEAANHAKSAFLANMSHEIRTPMNAILGFTQLMQRDPDLTQEAREHLNIVNRSGEHLLSLINDVLEMSKIEAGRTSLNPYTFDFFSLLDDLTMMFKVRTDAKDLQFEVNLIGDVPQYIKADGGKLRQILINLLSNAVKFTETGGVAMRVKVNDGEDGQLKLIVEVEDTGIGIESEKIHEVFGYFEQAKSRDFTAEGSGLGLSISREFIHMMEGEITVQSQVGVGSVFLFDVCIEIGNPEDVEEKQAERHVIALEPDQPEYRILVVDDKESNRLLLTKMLTIVGFSVRTGGNGREAIQVFEDWNPHLILMDMTMPVMDGYEATQWIKATPKGRETYIIVVTASVFEEDRKTILNIGADDYIRKPLKDYELYEKIQEALKVQYIYSDEGSADGQAALDMQGLGLTPESLSCLPTTLIDNMKEATLNGYLNQLYDLLDEVEAKDPRLAKAIRSLADRYDYDSLTKLFSPEEA